MKKIAAFFGLEEEISPVSASLAPLFLLMAAVLILKIPTFNYDLLFVAILGLFLTAKWRIQGCIAALLLLAFSAGAKHIFVPAHHIWQAGLESSVGIALFISALIFEQNAKWAHSKESELERNEKTILFLEEDLSQQKELLANEVAAAAEKLGALRVQLEESETSMSTLQILNDVLRKTSAKSMEERDAAQKEMRQFDRKEGLLLEEIDSLQKELNRLGKESSLVEQNKELFNELNAARVSGAQMQLINETLVRLHAKENQKARGYEEKLCGLEDELQNVSRALEAMQKERNALKCEAEVLRQKPFEVQEKRLEQYAQVELLYRQLKVQFEEKNTVLHEVRRDLFRTDTELQTVKKKLDEREFDPSPEVYSEIDALEEENGNLREENGELQMLVSSLMQNEGVKKK